MEDMCLGAVRRGVPEIAFTEHADFMEGDECRGLFRADRWWVEFERCRNLFRDRLIIRAGLEFGEPHRFPREFDALSKAYPWDVILGSLHWVEGTLVFHNQYFDRSPEAAYQAYFSELAELAAGPRFDVLAHPDIVKRYGYDHYGPFDPRPYEETIRRTLNLCGQRGIALELNTATLRRPVGEVSPDPMIIEWFRQEGGSWITLGSDAHQPDHVGHELDLASQLADAAGFEAIARWEARRVSPQSIA
jgi:histidinol-phosphatase (PHP family)